MKSEVRWLFERWFITRVYCVIICVFTPHFIYNSVLWLTLITEMKTWYLSSFHIISTKRPYNVIKSKLYRYHCFNYGIFILIFYYVHISSMDNIKHCDYRVHFCKNVCHNCLIYIVYGCIVKVHCSRDFIFIKNFFFFLLSNICALLRNTLPFLCTWHFNIGFVQPCIR